MHIDFMSDRQGKKSISGSVFQFPLTITSQSHIFILQEHKFNFSGKGPDDISHIQCVDFLYKKGGGRKQQTLNNERNWKTR